MLLIAKFISTFCHIPTVHFVKKIKLNFQNSVLITISWYGTSIAELSCFKINELLCSINAKLLSKRFLKRIIKIRGCVKTVSCKPFITETLSLCWRMIAASLMPSLFKSPYALSRIVQLIGTKSVALLPSLACALLLAGCFINQFNCF